MNNLSTIEQTELRRLEKIIDRGIKHFVEVGEALGAIREAKLYRENFETFDDYCNQTWGFTKQRASQLIQAARVERLCQPVVDVPNERVARAIQSIPDGMNKEAVVEWAKEKSCGKPLTEAIVREAIAEFSEAEPEEEPDDDSSLEEEATDTPQGFAPCEDTGGDDEEVEVAEPRSSEPPSAFAVAIEADVRRRMKEHGTQGFLAAVVLENLAIRLRG